MSADSGVMPAVDGVTPDLLPDKDRVYCTRRQAKANIKTRDSAFCTLCRVFSLTFLFRVF